MSATNGLSNNALIRLLKNGLDRYLYELHLINSEDGIDFTWFYALSGMDKVYERCLQVLSDPRLGVSENSTYLNLMGASGLYNYIVNTIYYDSMTDAALAHDL